MTLQLPAQTVQATTDVGLLFTLPGDLPACFIECSLQLFGTGRLLRFLLFETGYLAFQFGLVEPFALLPVLPDTPE